MRLFRYLSPQGLCATLESSSLRAARADTFNDLFEMVATLPIQTEASLTAFFSDQRFIERAYQKHCKGDDMPIDDYAAFVRGAVPNWVESSLKRQSEGEPLLDLEDYLESVYKTFYVISTSATPASTLMWSHYTDKHQGGVIEIETDGLFVGFDMPQIRSVLYRSEWPVTPLGFPDDEEEPEEAVLQSIVTKALAWSYEEEVRLLVNRPRSHDDLYEDIGISMECVKTVFIGAKATSPFEDELRLLMSSPDHAHISWKKAGKHKLRYELVFSEFQ